jgi:hypothetical protein
MGRKSKLTDDQWRIVHDRLMSGEALRKIGDDFGISPSAIHKRFGNGEGISLQSERVHLAANKIADAQRALEALPPAQRPVAMSLADKLKSISDSLASAAELGAKTAHRLQALSNFEVAKVDDADPMASLDSLRNVGVLTKLANDSAAIALNLVAANKETVVRLNSETPKPAAIPAARLSTEALREIVAARNAG